MRGYSDDEIRWIHEEKLRRRKDEVISAYKFDDLHKIRDVYCRAAAVIATEVNNEIRRVFGQGGEGAATPSMKVGNGHLTFITATAPLDPEESWKRWKAWAVKDGWTYGEKLDRSKKEHPNLIDKYEDLPEKEKIKDYTYWTACYAAHRAFRFNFRELDR